MCNQSLCCQLVQMVVTALIYDILESNSKMGTTDTCQLFQTETECKLLYYTGIPLLASPI